MGKTYTDKKYRVYCWKRDKRIGLKNFKDKSKAILYAKTLSKKYTIGYSVTFLAYRYYGNNYMEIIAYLNGKIYKTFSIDYYKRK